MGHWPGYVNRCLTRQLSPRGACKPSPWVQRINATLVTRPPAASGGTIAAPPSKSMAHRAVLCAALAEGLPTSNILNSARISLPPCPLPGSCAPLCTPVRTSRRGGAGALSAREPPVDCCESGSTLRFLIPIASLTGQKVTFTGRGRLMERPQSVYEKLYQQQTLRFEQSAAGLTVEGTLTQRIRAGGQRVQPVHQRAAVCPALAGSPQHPSPARPCGEPQLYRYDPTRCRNCRFSGPRRWLDETTLLPGGQQYRPRLQRGGRLQPGGLSGGAGRTVRRRDHHRPARTPCRAMPRFWTSCGGAAQGSRRSGSVICSKAPLQGWTSTLPTAPTLAPC